MTVSVLRVLCFHGYHGNASILRSQMAGLVSAMPSNIDFLYVDAPSLARGDFGWWHEGFSGWEHTLAWAQELFANQPRFDGVFGFSQGAALVGLLAAANESETYRTSEDSWFDFAAMVGGFKSGSPQHADLFGRKLAIPSVHVMGLSDGIVPSRDWRPSPLQRRSAASPPAVLRPRRELHSRGQRRMGPHRCRRSLPQPYISSAVWHADQTACLFYGRTRVLPEIPIGLIALLC